MWALDRLCQEVRVVCGHRDGPWRSAWLALSVANGDGDRGRRTTVHFLMFVIDDTSNSATTDETVAIDARGGEPTLMPGPLHDTSDYVAGFWIVSAEDHKIARELATRGSAACRRRVELRPLLGLAR